MGWIDFSYQKSSRGFNNEISVPSINVVCYDEA